MSIVKALKFTRNHLKLSAFGTKSLNRPIHVNATNLPALDTSISSHVMFLFKDMDAAVELLVFLQALALMKNEELLCFDESPEGKPIS